MFLVPVSRHAAVRARHFDRLFDDALNQFFAQPAADSTPVRRPAIDITESDSAYVVTLDVPGVTREDVQVSVDGRRVSIVAEARRPEAASAAPAADAAAAAPETTTASPVAERAIVRERAVASYARSFTLPSDIDQTASQARLDNGVLTLTLARRSPASTRLTVN